MLYLKYSGKEKQYIARKTCNKMCVWGYGKTPIQAIENIIENKEDLYDYE